MDLEIYEEENRSWKSIVDARWGRLEGGVTAREVVRPHGRDLWKKIGMGLRNFQECITWKVGKGNQTLLLEDEQVGRGRLKNLFPQIYAIA